MTRRSYATGFHIFLPCRPIWREPARIARAITRQHGGDITPETANDRVIFTVTLPTGM